MTAVDGGSTATYVYNALNQRVRTVVGSTATEFAFNAAGQRVSIWNGTTHAQLQGQYYWGGKPVAFYASGSAQFQHQDWLGTERMRTTYNGGVEGTFTSLPFGDGLTTASGTDTDAYHFASLDHDYETDIDHAQFRQYSDAQGHWMSPDPYSGSYDSTNPQSFNRYGYALNNPLSLIDPTGLDFVYDSANGCFDYDYTDEDGNEVVAGCLGDGGGGGPGGVPGPGSGPGGGGGAPNNGTSTCTVGDGRTTGVAPGQAPGPPGSVAIDPVALGLPFGTTSAENSPTVGLLKSYGSQITLSFSPAPNLPQGFPTTYTVLGAVGPASARIGGANFNSLFDFDFFGFPSLAAAYAATSKPGVPVSVTVTYPSSLPIFCSGQTIDSPIQGPLPKSPGPVSAVKRRQQ